MSRVTGFIALITIMFCIAVAFDVSPFLRGPAPYPPQWQWEYRFVNTLNRMWIPILFAGLIGFSYSKRKERIGVFVVLFFLFQFAVLFFQRAGIGVLLHRIIDPNLNGYFSTGIEINNLKTFLQTYNQHVLSFYQHAKGHPPFAVLFFYLIEKLFSFFPEFAVLNSIRFSNPDITLIWNALNNAQKLTALFTAVFIPFLSSITIVPLYKLVKLLHGTRSALISILLYIGVPSVVLFTPLNDVFLPFFTVWSLYLFVIGIDKKSKAQLFLSGLLFSVGLMFSLTFLPLLLVFAAIFFARKKVKMAIGMELGFLAGLFLIPCLLFVFSNLNVIELFRTLIAGLPQQRDYKTWVFYNLYDFFIFCGIPVLVLFFLNMKNQIKFLSKKLFSKTDPLFVSFVLMLFVLDILGSVRGEVSRIWLPYVPLVVIPAAHFLANKKFSDKQIILLFALQVLQLLVMQEFWVTLY